MTAANFCVNCRHAYTAGESAQRFPLCTHPNHGVSLVTGVPLRPACEPLRRVAGACGPQGLLFQALDASVTISETGTAVAEQPSLQATYAKGTLPPAPGAYWPEHQAHYAGLMVTPDGRGVWHLLLPDQVALKPMPWGEEGQDVRGATSIHDGHANTLAMAEAGSALAQAIRALPGDCYLPSRAEALLLFASLRDRFDKTWYRTSTQYSAYHAWVQYFDHGNQYIDLKDFQGGRAAAVRRLVLQPFNPFDGGAA